MSTIRVTHVLDHSLPVLSGYSTRTHHELRAQVECGIEPDAVTSPKHGTDSRDACIDGISYVRTPQRSVSIVEQIPAAPELDLIRRVAARAVEQAQRHQSQIIHGHSSVLTGIAAWWAARRLRLPLVYEIRAFWEDAAVDHGTHAERSPRYRLIRAMETWLMRRADAIGVISRGLGDEIQQRGVSGDKIFYVPNGVDTQLFRPAPADPGLRTRWGLDGHIVVGFIGSFYRYEGLDLLLQAWARVSRAVPEARLLLIGGGETAAALQAEVPRLGIGATTILAGSVPHEQVASCYSVCDVLVYPRKSMRLTELVTPLKPLEAMASGKAVVASNIGGMRELIRDRDTGLLFPAGDAEALAGVLEPLLRDPALRSDLGARARASVCREREWKTIVQVHVETYRRLLQQARVTAPRAPREQGA
jgi:PEP-CTERM/exosortase A-associated glycosyltransferase